MNKIDTKKWMEFGLESLFTITWSSTTPKNSLDFDNSNPYPYVTTAATNNWISWYSDKYTEDWNVLTVDSAVLWYCSYQEKNFTASDHVEKLIPKFKMTKRIALFLVSIINQTWEMLHYAYNEKRSQTALKKETIFLPVDSSWNPDREYMENYMKNLEERCKNKLQNLILARGGGDKQN